MDNTQPGNQQTPTQTPPAGVPAQPPVDQNVLAREMSGHPLFQNTSQSAAVPQQPVAPTPVQTQTPPAAPAEQFAAQPAQPAPEAPAKSGGQLGTIIAIVIGVVIALAILAGAAVFFL